MWLENNWSGILQIFCSSYFQYKYWYSPPWSLHSSMWILHWWKQCCRSFPDNSLWFLLLLSSLHLSRFLLINVNLTFGNKKRSNVKWGEYTKYSTSNSYTSGLSLHTCFCIRNLFIVEYYKIWLTIWLSRKHKLSLRCWPTNKNNLLMLKNMIIRAGTFLFCIDELGSSNIMIAAQVISLSKKLVSLSIFLRLSAIN